MSIVADATTRVLRSRFAAALAKWQPTRGMAADGPAILGGDFNAELATGDFDKLSEGSLVAASAADAASGAFSYIKGPRSLIDHIFLSPNLADRFGAQDYFIIAAEKTLALDSNFTAAQGLKGYVYALQGNIEPARAALRQCRVHDCADAAPAFLGYAYAVRGNRAEAMRHVERLEARWRARGAQSGGATRIAAIYAGLGERDRALDWLEKGVEGGENSLYLGIDPEFRPLHAEPRFRALLARLRLPEVP